MIEVLLVPFHQSVQVVLAQDQEVVEALPSQAAQETLADGVGRQSLLHPNGTVRSEHSK